MHAQGSGSVVTYQADLEMYGTARLLSPVMKVVYEKRAGGAERQMATVLNKLAITPGQSGASR